MASYKAKHAFGVQFDGAFVTIQAGEAIEPDINKAAAKLLKQLGKAGVEEHFEPNVGTGQFSRPDKRGKSVEQATAAPGEKR
jgi:hypothetical protein